MKVLKLSNEFYVRKLTESDIDEIFDLCKENSMYYRYCPPFVTKESILEDMKALPPKKSYEDKFYVGYFDNGVLIAVMDLILEYPNSEAAFIGFFMMNKKMQRQGIASDIITELSLYMNELGFKEIRLGYADGNKQSESFWRKNGFCETGAVSKQELYNVIVMQRKIKTHF